MRHIFAGSCVSIFAFAIAVKKKAGEGLGFGLSINVIDSRSGFNQWFIAKALFRSFLCSIVSTWVVDFVTFLLKGVEVFVVFSMF